MYLAPVIFVLLLAGGVMAAETPQLPEQQEEYKLLENFIGRWTTAGREGQFFETCEWYHGKFHVVCNSVSKRADGSKGHGMSILSYVTSVGYVYSGIGSNGRYEILDKGRWLEGKFVFDSRRTDVDVSVSKRISIGPFTSEGFMFVVSTSEDGVSWSEMDRTVYLRLK